MRKLFPGYYARTDEEVGALWEKGFIVFDTNVLLNLYRYSTPTAQDWLALMRSIRERLRLPHQVALEFQRNRLAVIAKEGRAFDEMVDDLDAFIDVDGLSNKITASKRFRDADVVSMLNEIRTSIGKIKAVVQRQRETHPNLLKNDDIREQLDNIFDGSVGKRYADEKIKEIAAEGAARYRNKIPPGFLDKGKDGDDQFGDLIIWRQLLEFASMEKRPVIFVTDDRKEDWWRVAAGMTPGPQPRLLDEFHQETSQLFHMYSSERFFEYAANHFGMGERAAVVEETRRVMDRNEVERWSSLVNALDAVDGGESVTKGGDDNLGAIESEKADQSVSEAMTFVPIGIKQFPVGVTMKRDIYLKLSANKYIKILAAGDSFSAPRLSAYMERGLSHFYFRRT